MGWAAALKALKYFSVLRTRSVNNTRVSIAPYTGGMQINVYRKFSRINNDP